MPMSILTTAISGSYPDIAVNFYVTLLKHFHFVYISIFYPTGELISLQSLRCSQLAVDHYSFVGHCLAFTATSTRE
jgi:hypothetical protein